MAPLVTYQIEGAIAVITMDDGKVNALSLPMLMELNAAFDQARAASRDLLELPPVLHRPAETDRHGRPRGAIHQEVRRADLREPQEGSRDGGGEGQKRDRVARSMTCCIFRSIRARR